MRILSTGIAFAAPVMACSATIPGKKLLVLGGTGFVGSKIIALAVKEGWAVTSLSRRGSRGDLPAYEGVNWVSGDASNPDTVSAIVRGNSENGMGQFDGVIHAIGMLVEGSANKWASGSGSVPDAGATFDQVTRQTAFAAMDAVLESPPPHSKIPFVFVSAAEVKWTFDDKFSNTPLSFLHRYFIAKRAVESRLQSEEHLRATILRPSLIWSRDRPFGIPPAFFFGLGNLVQRPFGLDLIDVPVNVDTLAAAAVKAIKIPTISGIFDGQAMEKLAARK
jgi:nucleoside-diphosphate-sugar epimerase